MARGAIVALLALAGCGVEKEPVDRICVDKVIYVDRKGDGIYEPFREPYAMFPAPCVAPEQPKADKP